MNPEIYLDNAATTKPCEACVAAVQRALTQQYYNPSSRYKPALDVANEIAAGRAMLADLCGTKSNHVYFLASGTDASNFAISSYASKMKSGDKVLYTAVEHSCIRETCKSLAQKGILVEEIPVNSYGIVDEDKLTQQLDKHVKLICIMHVNNELGSINPLSRITALRDRFAKAAAIHVDAVQGFLKVPFSFKNTQVQSYAISAHKFYGPKGIAALIVNDNISMPVYRYGGGQELGLVSGTENTAGIFGLIAAVKSVRGLEDYTERLYRLKMYFLDSLKENVPAVQVLGPPPTDRTLAAPHIINVSLTPLRSDVLINALAAEQIYCSSGSACSSMKQKISRVLQAIGVRGQLAESAVRVSFAPYNSTEEVERAVKVIAQIYNQFAKYVRR